MYALTLNFYDVSSSGIDFVKINDPDAAHRFNILHTPALVYFRKKVPLVYDGECHLGGCLTQVSGLLGHWYSLEFFVVFVGMS